MIVLRYLVVALTYLGLGLGYLPGLRMNRATIALSGAALLLALGVLNLSTAWAAIDYKTLVFLFGMMVVNANLEAAGFFQLAIATMLKHIRSPFGLLVALTFGSGILSALFWAGFAPSRLGSAADVFWAIRLTEGMQKLGSLGSFSAWVHSPLNILTITALLSNLVSNVPAVLLLHHLIPNPDSRTWLLLAAASTLAGNLTLLGSVANLIVAEAVAKQGYQLSFWEHLRFGGPLTLITLALAYIWLYGV